MGKDKERYFFPKGQANCPQPRHDVDWLSGWAERIFLHLEKDQPSKYSSMIFRPCQFGNAALMKLENSHPVAVQQVKGFLDFTEEQYKVFLNGNEAAKDNFPAAMYDLAECVKAMVDAINKSPQRWSLPATHKKWETRFGVKERTLRDWRNNGFRMEKVAGQRGMWRVHTEESIYIEWNSNRTSLNE